MIDRKKSARRGKALAGIQGRCPFERNSGIDALVAAGRDWNGEHERQRFDMTDGLAHRRAPESNDRNAAPVAMINGSPHQIWMRETRGYGKNVVLAPIVTRALERPQLVGLSLAVGKRRIEAVLLKSYFRKSDVVLACVLVGLGHHG